MPRKHGEKGEYVETVTPEDVLEVFDTVRGPVVLSADVSDALGVTRETARRKLQQLYDRDDVDRRKVSRRVVYWREEDAAHAPRTVESDDDAEDPGERQPPSGDAHGDESDTLEGRARERITDLDRPGSGKDYDRRRDAVLKMYNHLRDHAGERLSKSDFRELLDGDDVGYGAGFASLWANWVKGSGDRPNVLDELPHVELRGDDYVYENPDEGDL